MMGIFSILASLTTASATQRGFARGFVAQNPAAFRGPDAPRFALISVVLASKDALQARKALLACPQTVVVRCLPMSTDARVRLEIRFPAGQGDSVISQIVASVPNGQIGPIVACATECPKLRIPAPRSGAARLNSAWLQELRTWS